MSGLRESQHLKLQLQEIQLATNNFETCIGKGGYGWVYKGQLSIAGKPTTVAVKRLNEQFGQGLKEFLTEIQLLTGQNHPNLISLLGYCDEGNEKIIVYEYAENGSLDKYLMTSSSSTHYTPLTWRERLRICIDAARGLDHLHNHVGIHQTIIHRDIKSSNILIDENWVAKISDLGLSKLSLAGLNRSAVVSHPCGTPGYCEPEYFITGIVKKESDVYSFGMVLFEVLCGRLCSFRHEHDDGLWLSPRLAKDYYEKKKLIDIIDPRVKDEMSLESMNNFSAVVYGCLQDDRRDRPTMDLVVKELIQSLKIQVEYELEKEKKLKQHHVGLEFDDMHKSSYDDGALIANNSAGNNAKNTKAVAIQPILVRALQLDELNLGVLTSGRDAAQLADQVIKLAEEAVNNKQEWAELKSKTEKLAGLLRQAARASNVLYERPTLRIIDDTKQVLEEALSLALKCQNSFVNRVFSIIPAASFRKMSSQLENSIGNVSWLLRGSAPNNSTDEYLGPPPIAANEPILCLIWELIAILYTGTLDDRSDAAASLVSLVRDNDRYGTLIIEEGGVNPLLKLVKEGRPKGQENAASAIGLLGRDPESVEHMIHAGVCSVFVKILKEGPMKVQAVVAWAVSELVRHYPKCQDLFAQHNIVRLLVGHLAFETVEEQPPRGIHKGRELEDPVTKAYMNSMAAKALWHLAKDNATVCRSITVSRALLNFAVLLEKGSEEVRYNSAMALMEITGVAEQDSDLRRAAFKPNTPACKAIVEQLLQIIEKADSRLLLPCVKAIGSLARTFRATESRMIQPLVQLLEEREPEITKEAALALSKFACTENYLRLDHSKAIIGAGGAKHLVQLVYFGEQMVQGPALMLLCYIAQHVPDSEDLAQAEVLTVLEWASKQSVLIQNEKMEKLLQESKGRLELYQSRGSRGFH